MAVLERWSRDGTLVPGTTLCASWGVALEVLDQAIAQGKLFAVPVAGKQHCLGLLGGHRIELVAQVCRALKGIEPSGQLIFWMRRHGGLGGKTVSEALHDDQIERVLELAKAWADEHADELPADDTSSA